MRATLADILAALQHADSFFPSGAIAFSWGLEGLATDGVVMDAVTLGGFVRGQLLHRWAPFDRPFVAAAMETDTDRVYALDREIECLSLTKEQREGSARAGRSLLAVHERLGTADSVSYRAAIRDGRAHGHLPTVQGFVFGRLDFKPEVAQTASAYGVAVGAVSAAVRLGMVGAIDAQKIIAEVRPVIIEIVSSELPQIGRSSTFVPQAEIAMMRHESQTSRSFAN